MRVVPAAGRHCRGCTPGGRSTPCVDGCPCEERCQPPAAGPDSARRCDCRPAAGTTGRSTPCVDALCTEPRRQPRLASTTAGRSHTKKRRPCGRRLGLLQYSVEQARRYFAAAGALSFIIASRAALNGLPAYQLGQRSPPASSLPTPYISCRSSTVPSSFQVAASNSSFGPW